MKKRLIIVSIAVFLIVGVSVLMLLNNKDKGNNDNKSTKSTTSTNKVNSDYNYDFSNYKTIDVNLDELSSDYKITEAAIYHFTGKTNYSIEVDSDTYIKIILDNASINSTKSSINVVNSKGVYIELVGDNTLSDSTNNTDDTDAVIYSSDDLIIEGSGTLSITANYKDAIASKDDLVIKSGTYKISATDDGIRGKDLVLIMDGNFDITSNGDAIKSTNDTESDKGNIKISGGEYVIKTTNGDGISSINSIEITDGKFNITAGTESSNTDASMKGIKAENNITIKSITLDVNAKDDGIHTNADITIDGGTYNINTDDDGIHADGKLEINDGTISINSAEGLEATYVKINGGDITINASDDGINATNKSTNYDVILEINGGSVNITMGQGDTDALDSNGNLYINGGKLNITANSPFDYDGEAKYTSGEMIVNGSVTTTITNQMMGGGGMPQDNMQNFGGDMRRR